MSTADLQLTDRMSATDGMITLSGVQALLRAPVDQARADMARGLRTATLVCGYRGSPLGGVEGVIAQHRDVLEAADVRFLSGVNEDLAATAVWGSQMTVLEKDATFDGVKGIWYGKGPGVDRAGDAIRHAMFAGVGPNGGVLALAGDDPECKSSTIPSASEGQLADLGMPVLYPTGVADALRLSLYGFELSRASGLWAGIKVHTDVADGFATIPASTSQIDVVRTVHEVDGKPWSPTVDNRLISPFSMMLEEELFGHRLDAAIAFARQNPLDRTYGASDAWFGIIVAGKPHGDVIDALGRLGISEDELADFGIRILVPGMISPLDPEGLRSFVQGLDTVFVVEAKRSFIETQVRELLYGGPDMPAVFGKTGPGGGALLSKSGIISPDLLVEPLRMLLQEQIDSSRLARERERIPLLPASSDAMPSRTPYYCSGCPHNRSTVVPEGSIALGGIGCHSMALWMDRDTEGLTQMGGEGAQWVGAAPFVGDQHRFQNLGDGTFFHSGSLAIRQAVAADTNITYKILYNGVVAMTGGQDAAGEMPVPELTRWLDAEGVVQTVVVTDDVDKYDSGASWSSNSRVVDRSELDSIQRELRDVPGVTALVYDQSCAADLRRNRKRGKVATPTTRIMINEAICEGCGHCGEISNCMSVHPVETPFGRKTRIHQESCNFDLTCVDGNCPAFVTVEIDPNDRVVSQTEGASYATGDLPADVAIPESANLLIVGIGGTGVVTVSQVLSTAAMLDGRVSTSLDQTGLAQKGGQVVSNLHIGASASDGAAKMGVGDADTMLVFDVVGGTSPTVLQRAQPGETVAIVSTSRVPTGDMVSDTSSERFPEVEDFKAVIDPMTRAEDNVWIDAESIARHVFSSQPAANMLAVGIAHQLGRIPVSAGSIEQAIDVNGVAVDINRNAFRLGRRLAADPDLASTLSAEAAVGAPRPPAPTADVRRLLDQIPDPDTELAEVAQWRLPELIAWGGVGWAERWTDEVVSLRQTEIRQGFAGTRLSQAGARNLYKLMTYKDEYEVARLALANDMGEQARARFGPNASVSIQLKPPALKNAGYDKKIAVPEKAAKATFAGLLRSKRLRGSRLDPFGRTEERRIERALIDEYIALIGSIASKVTAETHDAGSEILELADMIRGYDVIKLGNVERYRRQLGDLRASSGL
jgi:indolepyruvate ferredoxin oxidoreductase